MRLHHILQIKKREKREVATFVAISFTYQSIRQTRDGLSQVMIAIFSVISISKID